MASELNKNYTDIISRLKEKIKQARLQAAVIVNKQLIDLFWEIGNTILQQQKKEGWGTKIIDRLAADLKSEFPDMKGLSARNIKYMRAFAEAYPNFVIVQPAVAQLQSIDKELPEFVQVPLAQTGPSSNPLIMQVALAQLTWYHHITLLDKIKEPEIRNFYIQKTAEHGWSRNVMVHQIESGLHKRQGALTNNFKLTLPAYDSELATQLFKDPYQFEFLMLGEEAKERDLENALMNHITKLLLELGDGFAFMGRQKKFEAGGKDYFIDLLFYHTKLRRHIIIELKIGEFEPEFVSKMNLYLGLADDNLKGEYDEPAIGLILCKTNNKIIAEYALRDTSKPIGIAEYKIAQMLPDDIKGELPSIAQIEQRMDEELKEKLSPTGERLKAIREKVKQMQLKPLLEIESLELLDQFFQKTIKKLFLQIINEVTDNFGKENFTQKLRMGISDKIIYNVKELEKVFSEEKLLKKDLTFFIEYSLGAFKMSGHKEFFIEEILECRFKKHWYEFKLFGPINAKVVLEKMHHETPSKNEINDISNAFVLDIIAHVEHFLNDVDRKNTES